MKEENSMSMALTVGIRAKLLHDIADANVDNTKETLILLLELFLVKDLNSENAALICAAIFLSAHTRQTRMFPILQVEAFVPVRVQRSLANTCGLGLLAIDGGNSKGIGEA